MALTTAGVKFISQAVIGLGTPFSAANAYLAVGDGSDTFDVSQTDLQGANTLRKSMDVEYPMIEPPNVTFKATFAPAEANFPWHEWGIFNASAGGVMLNRVVESNGTKQNNQTWVLEVDIEFSIGN